MDQPKTKTTNSAPKVMKKSVRNAKGIKQGINKVSEAAVKTKKVKDEIEKQIPDENKYHSPEEYMTGTVSEKTSYAARKVGSKLKKDAKRLAEKEIRKAASRRHAKKNANTSSQTNTTQNPKHNDSGKRTGKSMGFTGKKNTVKKTEKAVKTADNKAKAAKKGIKTSAKTVKKSANSMHKTVAKAKRVSAKTAKAFKLSIKAVKAAVKAVISAAKGLITLISAGGLVVAVVILIIAVILLIISSPFGIFASSTDGETPTIQEVVEEINEEYTSKIDSIIINAGNIDEVIIEGESADAGYAPTNWIDVLGVFSVKATMSEKPNEYMDVLIMDEKKVEELQNVFWAMNIISYEIEEEIVPTPIPTSTPSPDTTAGPEFSPTPEPTPEVIRTLIISMEGDTYEQGAMIYNFSDEQNSVLSELMLPEYLSMFMELCGMDAFNGLTQGQLVHLVNDLPSGELGSVIVEYALSRLGDPYSQGKRGQGSYVDCSYLARWCYQQAGVIHFTAGTAAEQARYCVNNNLSISKSDLQVGDLIFWSFNPNGRFMDITHVGIYAGNGYVIDASSSRGMVVYRPIFGESSIVVCGRPHVK